MEDELLVGNEPALATASVLAVDFATLAVTACTILVAGALAIIAFYLNRDFREQVRASQEQGREIENVKKLLRDVEARIDRNVSRDVLMTKIVFDIVGDLINAEKIGRYSDSQNYNESLKIALEAERNMFFRKITRRVREISLILADRDDKREQILSEIVAEEPDLTTIDFLSSFPGTESDEVFKKRLGDARAVAQFKYSNLT